MIAEAFPKKSFLGEAAGGRGTTLPASASQRNSGFAPRRRAGPVRAGCLPELARRRAKRSHAPRRDTLPPPRQQPPARGSPALSRAAGGTWRDGGTVPPPPLRLEPPPPQRSGNTSRPEERGAGCGGNKRLCAFTRGTECEAGGVTSLGCGDRGVMSPFVPGERRACLRPSSSSTPDLMGIKIQEIKPPPQPYRTRIHPPSLGLLEGRHSLIVSCPPSPLKAAATRRSAYLPRVPPGPPGRGGLSARLSAQAKRSFPLLRSRRAAPAPSPQPGAPEVSAGGSQPGRHRRLHSPPGRGAADGGRRRRRRRTAGRSPTLPGMRRRGGCLLLRPAVSPGPARSLLRAVRRRSPAPSVRPSRSPSPAPLPGGEPRGAQAPPAARRTRGRRGIPARPPVLSPGPGAHSPRGEEALPRPGGRQAAPGRSPARRSRARRGSLRRRRRRYCCQPGLSGRWVPRSARARSVPVPGGRLRV